MIGALSIWMIWSTKDCQSNVLPVNEEAREVVLIAVMAGKAWEKNDMDAVRGIVTQEVKLER